MPLWDSVQRGLEKASQEAARMARTQRMRSALDGLAQQMGIQGNNVLNKTMELFIAGQITHPELVPLCQELLNLQQQFNQLQNELQQAQAAQARPQAGAPSPYTTGSGGATVYQESDPAFIAPPPPSVQPDYQTYLDSPDPFTVPPPPPGADPSTEIFQSKEERRSAEGTRAQGQGTRPPLHATPPAASINRASTAPTGDALSPGIIQRCPVCQAEVQPGHSFCQNCGSLIRDIHQEYQPTMRAGTMEPGGSDTDATARAGMPPPPPPAPASPGDGKQDGGT